MDFPIKIRKPVFIKRLKRANMQTPEWEQLSTAPGTKDSKTNEETQKHSPEVLVAELNRGRHQAEALKTKPSVKHCPHSLVIKKRPLQVAVPHHFLDPEGENVHGQTSPSAGKASCLLRLDMRGWWTQPRPR